MTEMERKAGELADKVEALLAAIDDEMEHGKYGTPEAVPQEYEDEPDYYAAHEVMVCKVVDLRTAVRKLIYGIRREVHAAEKN